MIQNTDVATAVTTPSAADIAAAHAIVNEIAGVHATTPTGAPAPSTEGVVVNEAKKQELTDLFTLRINTPRFWENPNRVTRLEAALILPMFDDPSMRMFYDSALDELMAIEFKNARLEKRPPVDPTEDQIIELAEQKHHEKYIAEPARKAERAALRAAKKK